MTSMDLAVRLCIAVTVLAIVGGPAAGQNAVPMLINYQGELRSPSTGEHMPDGAYDMVFRIYDVESGGTALWEGSYSAGNGNPVEVRNGIFSVILGSGVGNALDLSAFDGPDRWLEIELGTEMLSPRQRLTSVAYSMISRTAEDADTVDGMEGTDIEESAEIDADIAAHTGIADAHHERYTDAEAVAAMGAKSDENPLNHDRTMSLPWASITDVPAGFADGEDNDTTYTPGTGLSLLDTQFNVEFGGSGAADAAARSDHHHDGAYAPDVHIHDAIDIVSGALDTARFSAYDDLATEGHLDGDAGTDLMTVDAGNGTYWALRGNGATNPATHFVGTTDNQPLEVRVNSGRALRLEPGSSPNIIGGYATNRAEAGTVGATVGGGGEAGFANRVTDDFGTVGGGRNNQAGDGEGTTSDKAYASIGGGAGNLASGMYATVGGGLGNEVTANYGTIAGGGRHDPIDPSTRNRVLDHYGTVGGGGNNQAGSDDADQTNAAYATCAGGRGNVASGPYSTVGGGFYNEVRGFLATIAGGSHNEASGYESTVGGGFSNRSSGDWSVVPGGNQNVAGGLSSFAAGFQAKANHGGSFVWGDSQAADVASSKNDEVTFRCQGGVRFLSGSTGTDQTVSWAPGDSSWTFSSARNLKEDFVEVDAREVLEKVVALPIAEWNFKGYSERHIGPVAQDFHALFPLGGNDTMIDSGDLHGVALSAIQGLHELLREKDAKISTLEARIEALESLVGKLVESQARGEE